MDNIKFRIARACHPANIQKLAHEAIQWLREHARLSLYSALALVTIIWAAFVLYNRFKSRNVRSRSRSLDLEKRQPTRTDSSKTKFAMEKPGGKTDPTIPSQSLQANCISLEIFRLQASTRSSLPQLVRHRNQTPPLPALPTQVLHHHGTAQHGLGRVDRAR